MADAQQDNAPASAANPQVAFRINPRGCHWEVIDPAGKLVCLTVYKRGAKEVVRRLAA